MPPCQVQRTAGHRPATCTFMQVPCCVHAAPQALSDLHAALGGAARPGPALCSPDRRVEPSAPDWCIFTWPGPRGARMLFLAHASAAAAVGYACSAQQAGMRRPQPLEQQRKTPGTQRMVTVFAQASAREVKFSIACLACDLGCRMPRGLGCTCAGVVVSTCQGAVSVPAATDRCKATRLHREVGCNVVSTNRGTGWNQITLLLALKRVRKYSHLPAPQLPPGGASAGSCLRPTVAA